MTTGDRPRSRARGLRLVPIALVILLLSAGTAAAQVGYSGSTFLVASRDDSDARVWTWYLVNGVDVATGPVRLTVMVPILSQQVLSVDATQQVFETVRRSGVGDPTVRVDLMPGRRRLGGVGVEASAAVKVPVRSVDSGLGTGHADVAFGATFSGAWNRNTWMIDASYWILGDSPDLPLRNTPALYAGYGRVLDNAYRWSLIVAASTSPSAVAGFPSTGQVNLTVLRLLSSRGGIGATVGLGLTESTPDVSIGASWRAGF